MSEKSEKAVATFKKGFNCSQSVLSAFAADYGLSIINAQKIAAGFGGGIGRMAETCGAVSGAIMALGLHYGMSSEDPFSSNEATYQLVGEFLQRFKARHKTVVCRDLLGYDISNRQTLLEVRKLGLFRTVCPPFVRDAVEIMEALIKEHPSPKNVLIT